MPYQSKIIYLRYSLNGSKSAEILNSMKNAFIPNPYHNYKSNSSYFGSEEDEESEESEYEWAHPGISMDRIEEKISDAINESNKLIDSKIQNLSNTLKNDMITVIEEIKQNSIIGITKSIDNLVHQMSEDKKTIMNMIFDLKLSIEEFNQRLSKY